MSKLPVLYEALKRVPKVPLQRKVVMVTRLNCKAKQNTITELRAKDDFARVLGGYVLPSLHKPQDVFQDVFEYEVVTWNTGEASDLRWLANRSHAEAQLYEYMRGKTFDSIEVEITQSPCTACADMLGALLKTARKLDKVSRTPNRRVGNRVSIGSAVTQRDIPAVLRWALHRTPPQATEWHTLELLHNAGWKLMAPLGEVPSGDLRVPVEAL